MKKILIIILLVVIVGIGLWLWFGRGIPTPSPSAPAGSTGSLPVAVTTNGTAIPSFFSASSSSGGGEIAGQLSIVSEDPTIAYFVNQGGTATIVQPDGEIIQFDDNQSSTLSSTTMENVAGADFSYDGQRVIVSYGDQADPQTAVFEVASSSWLSLVGALRSPQWSPSDDRLAYLEDNGNGTETLFTADFSKAKPIPVALGTFYLQDMVLVWAGPNQIFLYDKPSAYTIGSAFLFNIKNKTLSLVVTGRSGLEMTWATSTNPVGLSFVIGSAGYGGHLQLIDTSGDALQNLSFVTLPSKCIFGNVIQPATSSSAVFASSSITDNQPSSTSSSSLTASSSYLALYCGVPRDQTALGYYHLPDDYEQRTIFTSDDIYSVNTVNGEISTTWNDQTENLDITDPQLFDGELFFVNRYDQKLYSVTLGR